MDAAKLKRRRDDAAGADAAGGGGAHTVYVEGLPYSADEASIRAFFASAGAIVAVRAPRWQDSGRLRGYAHVDFGSASGAAAALALDGKELGGRWLRVAAARPPGAGADALLAYSTEARPAGCASLFVKGLPYDCDEAAVRAAFARFGAVASVRLARWGHTANAKGFGYVTFARPDGADAAMAAYRAGMRAAAAAGGARAAAAAPVLAVGGRPVHLDWETGAPRASFKTGDGRAFAKTEEAALVPSAAKAARAAADAAPAAAADDGDDDDNGGGGGGGGGDDDAAAADAADVDAAAEKKARRRKRKERGGKQKPRESSD